MAQKLSLNSQLSVTGNNTINTPMIVNLTTTGSNHADLTPIVTSSWQVLSQGSNTDFLIGVFKNTDVSQSIYIAQGGTGSYAALLTPTNNTCLLTNSGSTVLYAKTNSGSAQLVYTVIGYN